MLSSSSIALLLTLPLNICLSSASPLRSRSPYSLKDKHTVPIQWTNVGPAPKHQFLDLHIGLRQGNFDELERHLYEVSDPDHDRYGQHLSAEEVNELVKPSSSTSDSVHEWLRDHSVGTDQLDYSPAGDWIKVTLPVGKVEEMLQTEYSVFKHDDGTYMIRTPEWSLPKHLHDHVEAIQPTNSFLRTAPQINLERADNGTANASPAATDATVDTDAMSPPSDSAIAKVCDLSAVTPTCLRTLYGTIHYHPRAAGQNRVGMTNYLGEASNRSDVSIFLQKNRPEAAKAAYDFDVQVIAGGDDQQTPDNATQLAHYKDVEGNLDAETILGIAYPTPMTVYSTGGSPPFQPDKHDPVNFNEPYLTWLNYVLQQSTIPQVISNSYADDEQTVPLSYAKAVCNQFAQLGARGVTVLFGSGDFGVGKTNTCFSNDGKNSSTFLPAFPASCPYVTTVGATKNINPEIVAFDAAPPKPNPANFASGTGFSNYFPRPAYQNGAVAPYVRSLGDQYKGLYNPNGRAYPDISAQGQRLTTIWNGSELILDGTSCSTPVASAIISLVNDALIARGKSPLGFMNPWLYSKGYQAFTDVLSGNTPGCGVQGFPASRGWDVASGFGTPYFPKLKKLALDGCL